MHRIDGANHVGNRFSDDSSPGTRVTDDWLNAVQEELVAVIAAASIALDKENNGQLLAAIQAIAGVPSGTVAHTARATAPAGWLLADGSAVSRSTYAALFAAIGVVHGPGNGSTTFNVPDLRGEFIRGLDSGRNVDTGRALGSMQADTIKAHTHPYEWFPGQGTGETDDNFQAGHTQATGTTGANGAETETRPRNVALLAIIKT